MPSPLNFMQTLSQKVLAGSNNELGLKTDIQESDSAKANAFSSALNQALRNKLNQANQSKAERTNKSAEISSPASGEKSPEDKAVDNLEPADKAKSKGPKNAKDEMIVELAMTEGASVTIPMSDDQPIPAEAFGLSEGQSQSEATSILGQVDPQTDPMIDSADVTVLAQSVGLSSFSPEAFLMAGLSLTAPVQNASNTMDFTASIQSGNEVPTSAGIEGSSLPANPVASFTQSPDVTQTNLGLPQSLLGTAGPQSPGFGNALQSTLPAQPQNQAQREPLAQAGLPLSIQKQASEFPMVMNGSLDTSMESGIPELNQTLNQASAPNTPVSSNSAQPLTPTSFDPITSPLTTSLPEVLQDPQSFPNPFDSPVSESHQVTQGLPLAPGASVSPLATAQTAAEALPLDAAFATSGPRNESGIKPAVPNNNGMKELLEPLADLQQSLNALNGDVEALTQSPEPELENSLTLAEEFSFDISDNAQVGSDALPSVSTAGPLPPAAGLVQNTAANGLDKPQPFASLAHNPVDQVVDATVYSVKNGQKELILKINPDNLGEVRIRLTSHGNNEMSARLIASTQEGHELLKTQAETLKASLEAQGIHIEKISVMLAGQTDNDTNPNKQNSDPHSQQQTSSQSNSPQQSFQQSNQPFNPFFQSNNGAYQNKQGFAQNPGSMNNQSAQGSEENNGRSTEPVSRRNDNGNVSVLA